MTLVRKKRLLLIAELSLFLSFLFEFLTASSETGAVVIFSLPAKSIKLMQASVEKVKFSSSSDSFV
jgi:hypothetical protein